MRQYSYTLPASILGIMLSVSVPVYILHVKYHESLKVSIPNKTVESSNVDSSKKQPQLPSDTQVKNNEEFITYKLTFTGVITGLSLALLVTNLRKHNENSYISKLEKMVDKK